MNFERWTSRARCAVPYLIRIALLEAGVKSTSFFIVYRCTDDISVLVPPAGNCAHRDGAHCTHWYVTDATRLSPSGDDTISASGPYSHVDKVSCIYHASAHTLIQGGSYVVVGEDTFGPTGSVVKRTIRCVVVTPKAMQSVVIRAIRNGSASKILV